jgi:hypothetical protein
MLPPSIYDISFPPLWESDRNFRVLLAGNNEPVNRTFFDRAFRSLPWT